MKFDLYVTLSVAAELARRNGDIEFANHLIEMRGALEPETVTDSFEEYTQMVMDAFKFHVEKLEALKYKREEVDGYA